MGDPKPSIGQSVVNEDQRKEGRNLLLAGVRPTDDDLPMEVEEGVVETEVTTVDEGEVVLSDDAAMSVGDSEEDEIGTDGFSGVDGSSSDGESIVSHISRKRMAEESPEREPVGLNRKEFPGTVVRSVGGCRIYVPPAFSDGTRGSGQPTAMGGCAGVRGVSVPTVEAFDVGNVPPSTKSGESEILQKSEGKRRADNMCAVVITAGDKGVEVPMMKVTDTSDVTSAVMMTATTDIGKVLRTDVAAEVSGTTMVMGAGLDTDNAVLLAQRHSSTTVVATDWGSGDESSAAAS